MPSNFTNLTVTWFKASFNYATTKDITEFVTSIPLFTEAGSGDVNEAQIVLSANFGDFISDDQSPETPVEQYDRFRIQVTDLEGNEYDRFFELKPKQMPSQTKAEGTMLTLDLIGIEYHTQQIHFNRAFWFRDAFEVAREIGTGYEATRGSRQPELLEFDTGYSTGSKTGNGFPKSTVNHYEYGLHEDFCYNRWMDQMDKLGGSVDTGGVLDFFDLAFETTGINEIRLAIFSQGSRTNDFAIDANLPIIKKGLGDEINIGEQEGGLAPATGNTIMSWGAEKAGSYPTGRERYISGVFQFFFRPEFVGSVSYDTDAKVKFMEQHYKSKIDDNLGNTPPGPTSCVRDEDANWRQIDMSDEFGDSINYSDWTTGDPVSTDGAARFKNAGSNPRDLTIAPFIDAEMSPGNFDMNIVINDNNTTDGQGFFRTWVDAIASTDAELSVIANFYAYSGQSNLFPVGFRVLVKDAGTGVFAGNDPDGVPFEHNVVEMDEDGIFRVKYAPASSGTTLDQMQVAVLDQGLIYFYTTTGSPRIPPETADTWEILGTNNAAIPGRDLFVDCFHTYNELVLSESFDPKPTFNDCANFPDVTVDGSGFAKNTASAVKVTYDSQSIVGCNRLTQFGSGVPNGAYYKAGAWLCFRIPFSNMTFNGVSIGDKIGRGGASSPTPSVNFPGLEPSQLTTQNMDFTHDGNQGYVADSSEDYGQFQSLAGVLKFDQQDEQGISQDGINTIRCCVFDRADNVMFQDFESPFIARFFPFDLPISGFQNYRARKPVYFDLSGNAIADMILPKELSIQNQFEWRNIKLITFHSMGGYDKFGRYFPEGAEAENPDIDNVTLGKLTGAIYSMAIDDLHFTKPLLAISKIDFPIRALEPQFLERTHISTYDQLVNDADAEREKQRFQHEQYTIKTSGSQMFDLKFGDGIFFQDPTLTDREDNTSTPGVKSFKGVIRRIEYSITSPGSGVGGLTRNLQFSRRFV